MLSVFIVDDSNLHIQALRRMIASHPRSNEVEVEEFGSLEGFRARVESGVFPDVLFMDVEFAGSQNSGIDAVKGLIPRNSPTQVIYMTSYIEYCSKVYETRHVWFLPKPFKPEDFDKAFETALVNASRLQLRPLLLQHNGELNVVPVHLVRYIEADHRIARVHVGDKVYEVYKSLKEFADQLPERFVACHKSYLVNLDWVVRVGTDAVELKDGELVPLSVRRRAEFCRRLTDYVMDC